MNIQKLLKQAQQMQADLAKNRAALAEKTITASAGGEKVTITGTGDGKITGIKINPSIVDPNDVEFLEELVTTSIQDFLKQAENLSQQQMGNLGNLPNMPSLS